ncbi:uncharacterized protein LOC6548660 [Drosophila erecta]|uniref:uncharacterized protein LOC6548660 n=1 Tax=Drosophila erecta TaxID=7220 RepID=UPI0001780993|nr:uncharacterized protein LOC6548660 [Drosophila erecta]
MDSPLKQRQKPKKLDKPKLNTDPSQAVGFNKDVIAEVADQSVVYDYMNYPSSKAKGKLLKRVKPLKNVTFKTVVELVTYTENWKMKMCESKLRTEEEQVKHSLKRRNF